MSSTPPPARPRAHAKRARVACLACQQKKQKCDGRAPSCGNCVKASRTCIIEDPSTKRHYPRGYVEALEQRVARLESSLDNMTPRLQEQQPQQAQQQENQGVPHDPPQFSDLTSDVTAVASNLQVTTHDHENTNHHQSNNDDNAKGDGDGPSSLDLLCLRAAGGEPHYFGSSSSYSFTKLFSARLRGAQFRMPGLAMGGVSHPYVQERPRPVPAPLPDREATRILTNTYFENVHPQFPFLHKPTFDEYEDDVMTACENGIPPDPVRSYFVYMVAAVGSLTGPFAGATLPEGLYAAGEELFEHVLQLNSLETIQALLCCAMYSLRSPIGVSIWTLSGLAVRQCIELGLHRDIPWSRLESNTLKTQLRRRVFWCSYNLDRASAVTLGRPVGIGDADIDVDLFLDIDDENITPTGFLCPPRSNGSEPPTTVSSALHTIKLRKIWARMQNQIYPQTHDSPSPGNRMVTENFKETLEAWMQMAPEQLQQGRAANNAFASPEWYKLMYHHSILLLHRGRLVVTQRSNNPQSPMQVCEDASVFLDCASSSQAICDLYRTLYVSQRLNDTWGALHVLFLAGLTYIYCLWNSADTRQAIRRDVISSTCTSCMIVLAVMAERWASVAPYRDIFEMLSNATQAMLVDTDNGVNSSPRGPVLSSLQADQVSNYFMSMTDVGMCSSIEQLLMDMI